TRFSRDWSSDVCSSDLGVGLMLNGHSVNSTDPAELQQAADTIIAMKPYVAAFTYESRPMVAAGDVAAAHYFIGSMIDVFANPKRSEERRVGKECTCRRP